MKTLNPKVLQTVEATTLKQWLDGDKITLIDVREPVEYAGEHLPNARLVPLSQFDPNQILVEEDKTVVLYCRNGDRSTQAARKLWVAGFEDATHLSGGINDWKKQGLPTIVNDNAPLNLMRQVQIVAGSFVLIGTLLGAFVSPWLLNQRYKLYSENVFAFSGFSPAA